MRRKSVTLREWRGQTPNARGAKCWIVEQKNGPLAREREGVDPESQDG